MYKKYLIGEQKMKFDILSAIAVALTLIIVFGIAYAIAVSDLPEWMKFFLLK